MQHPTCLGQSLASFCQYCACEDRRNHIARACYVKRPAQSFNPLANAVAITISKISSRSVNQKNKVQREADGTPKPRTAHTLHPVPFIVVDPTGALDVRRDLHQPGIASIGATVLACCDVPVPVDYLPSLVVRR